MRHVQLRLDVESPKQLTRQHRLVPLLFANFCGVVQQCTRVDRGSSRQSCGGWLQMDVLSISSTPLHSDEQFPSAGAFRCQMPRTECVLEGTTVEPG